MWVRWENGPECRGSLDTLGKEGEAGAREGMSVVDDRHRGTGDDNDDEAAAADDNDDDDENPTITKTSLAVSSTHESH